MKFQTISSFYFIMYVCTMYILALWPAALLNEDGDF